MQTMDWCTVEPSRKRKPSRLRFKPGWRSAIWKCIRRRPRSSTAKTGSEKVNIRTSNLTFLGIAFGLVRVRRLRDNSLFGGFNPAVSSSAMKAMRKTIRDLNLRRQTQLSLQDIAQQLNPLLWGWIAYYGRYAPSALYPLLRYVNQTLVAWVMRKFKRFKRHKVQASQFLQRLATEWVDLFVHWRIGMTGVFA